MTTIQEALKGQFVGKSEFLELQKAITTAANSAGDIIQPELDPQLQNLVVKKYPFYTWLDAMGRINDTRSNKPSYIKKVTGGAGDFIAEAGDIPSTTDSVYDLLTGTMTTYVFPLEISDQMIMGGQDGIVDIMAQEIEDGLEYGIQAINNEMLNGTGASDGMNGLIDLIDTNTKDMNDAEITTQFELDTLCHSMMAAGGVPSAVVTSANVLSQLIDVLYPNVNIPLIPRTELAFGYQVTRYDSPAGEIPIIVDPAMPTTDDAQELLIVDYSTLMLKYLMRPTIVDLAKTKLTESSVLASFQSFMCRAESFNARMYDIGTKDA